MFIKDENFDVICNSIDETINILTRIGETGQMDEEDAERLVFKLLTANSLLKLEKLGKMRQDNENLIMKLAN